MRLKRITRKDGYTFEAQGKTYLVSKTTDGATKYYVWSVYLDGREVAYFPTLAEVREFADIEAGKAE